MKITQWAEDVYEVVVCGGLRRIVVTGARLVIRRSGRVGGFVQRLVGFIDATSTRFEATIRHLTGREVNGLVPYLSLEAGIGERLLGRVMRRLGARETLKLLVSLAFDAGGLLVAA